MPPAANEVLDFWFGPPADPDHAKPRPRWFVKSDAFDTEIRGRFGSLIESALAGELNSWRQGPVQPSHPLASLALIILLDQFTRNAFRGSARAFAGDGEALRTAIELRASGADRVMTGVQRQFAYLPYEHAEDMGHQRLSVQLFRQLGSDDPALAGLEHWAQRHLDIVERFGRFPHRNASLGRASTAEELAFISQPGSGF